MDYFGGIKQLYSLSSISNGPPLVTSVYCALVGLVIS